MIMCCIVVVVVGLLNFLFMRMFVDWFVVEIVKVFGEYDIEVIVDVIELCDYVYDIMNNMLIGFVLLVLEIVINIVVLVDVFIVVMLIFLMSYLGLFKLFIDVFDFDVFIGKFVFIGVNVGMVWYLFVIDYVIWFLFVYLYVEVVLIGVFVVFSDWGGFGDDVVLFVKCVEKGVRELVDVIVCWEVIVVVDLYDLVIYFGEG